MNTPHIPTECRNTRGTPRDMVRPAPIFCHADETLLIREQWKGTLFVKPAEIREYKTARDVLGLEPYSKGSLADIDTFDIRIVGDSVRDVTEEVAEAYLDAVRNGEISGANFPTFVSRSHALADYRDERAEPSVAEENRLGKHEYGVA